MSHTNVAPLHPLLTREIRPPRNWNEWRKCWEASTATHQLLGLLHSGFEVGFERFEYGEQEYDRTDRLETYFAIADGWADAYYQLQLETDGDAGYVVGCDKLGNLQRKKAWELRQQLARKAFDMLIHNFFKPEIEDLQRLPRKGEESWGNKPLSGRLFLIILDFFRIEIGRNASVRNLSSRHASPRDQQYAIDFLLELIKSIFWWEEKEIESWMKNPEEVAKQNIDTRQRIDSAKLWAIEVLACLDKLDLLWEVCSAPHRGLFGELEEPCLAKLKEIALRRELFASASPVSKTRQVVSLDEACYAGSKAAWFLKKYEIMKTEYARLWAIQQAERQMQEAARDLEKLTTTG